jgi:RimJ/RimL family protein N-acetyltransferase
MRKLIFVYSFQAIASFGALEAIEFNEIREKDNISSLRSSSFQEEMKPEDFKVAYDAEGKMSIQLETSRLLIRTCGPQDFPLLEKLWTDPQVAQTLFSDGQVPPQTQIQNALGYWDRLQAKKSFLTGFLVFEKGTEKLAGYVAVSPMYQDQSKHVHIEYALHSHTWKKGYGSEIVNSVIHSYLETDKVSTQLKSNDFYKVKTWVDPNNVASTKILEKTGFTVVQDSTPEAELEHHLKLEYTLKMPLTPSEKIVPLTPSEKVIPLTSSEKMWKMVYTTVFNLLPSFHL